MKPKEQKKKVYDDYKKQLNNKIKESIKLIDELKKKIKRFSNKNGIISKRKNKIDVTDKKCYKSIEKLWYNNYNSPSLEATIEIVDGDKNELKYNNEKEKVLDFYSVLNNCSPLKNTLVAGIAIAPKSSLSQLTSRIDPPQINSIFQN